MTNNLTTKILTLKKSPVISFPSESTQINFRKNYVWITAYHKRFYVRNMTTSHINNCIKCLEGRGNMTIPENYLGGKEKWLKIFNDELIKRN